MKTILDHFAFKMSESILSAFHIMKDDPPPKKTPKNPQGPNCLITKMKTEN